MECIDAKKKRKKERKKVHAGWIVRVTALDFFSFNKWRVAHHTPFDLDF